MIPSRRFLITRARHGSDCGTERPDGLLLGDLLRKETRSLPASGSVPVEPRSAGIFLAQDDLEPIGATRVLSLISGLLPSNRVLGL